jgi:hypothetical protein
MALSFDDALTAVIGRLTAAGLKQARSPLGVKNESAPRIDRSFSVLPIAVAPPTQRGRDRHRAAYRFRVELCHALKPSDGLEAADQALKDWTSSIKYLTAAGTALTTEAAIDVGGTAYTYAGGGAFLVGAMDIVISSDLPLAI